MLLNPVINTLSSTSCTPAEVMVLSFLDTLECSALLLHSPVPSQSPLLLLSYLTPYNLDPLYMLTF